jgi:hypothetical protein
MPRQFRSQELLDCRSEIAGRLKITQVLIFGTGSTRLMADSIGVAHRAWYSYLEGFRAIPGEIILRALYRHGIDPLWLLRGEQPVFRPWPGAVHVAEKTG